MKARASLFAAAGALMTVAVVAGCAQPTTTVDTQLAPPPTVTDTTGPSSAASSDGAGTDVDVDSAPGAPQAGRSSTALRSVANYFAVHFSQFSPFTFDPAAEWFDSWQALATPQLVGKMQVGLIDEWGWTWQQQVKAFDSRIVGTTSVSVNDADDTAVATVVIDRLVLGINDTADKSRQQTRRYRLQLALRGAGDIALVSAVDESAPGQ